MNAIFQFADGYAFFWLAAIVVLVAIEAATMGLYTIWFAGGSLIAFFVALMNFNWWVQVGTCLVVSGVLLFFTRPIVYKKLNRDRVKTNVDSLIDEKARVLVAIDNIAGTGRAIVKGQEWMARSVDDEVVIPEGAIVSIVEISGAKIIVKKEEV